MYKPVLANATGIRYYSPQYFLSDEILSAEKIITPQYFYRPLINAFPPSSSPPLIVLHWPDHICSAGHFHTTTAEEVPQEAGAAADCLSQKRTQDRVHG